MSDDRAAARAAAAAYELWQQDCLEPAEAKYREALTLASADHFSLADYHSEFAAVLEALEKDLEAEQHLVAALAVETARAVAGDQVGAVIARYFLADFYVRHGQAQPALDTVQAHLDTNTHGIWLLYLVAAEAWVALTNTEAAEQAARLALRAAPSEDKRSELRLRFLEIGLHDAGV